MTLTILFFAATLLAMMSRIIDALREARIAAGLTQLELADLLGCTQAFVSHVEIGRRALPEKLRDKLPEPIRAAVIKATKAELRERIKRLDRIGKEPKDAGTGC